MDHSPLVPRWMVGGFATFLATWWLIGDQSESSNRRSLDYITRAPDVPEWVVIATGLSGLVVAMAILLRILSSPRSSDLRTRQQNIVIVCFLGVGFVAAGTARLVTAGSEGANIGGVLAMFCGSAIVVGLVGIAVGATHKIRD